MNVTYLILVVRAFAIFFSSITVGMSAVILWKYFHAPVGTPRKIHIILIGISYDIWVIASMWSILDKILHREPWEIHSSPLALVASTFGVIGLVRLFEARRRPKAVA